MAGTGEHHLKRSQPGSVGQKVHVLTHMQMTDPKQMQ
jgi:hypothetical protein